MCSKNGKWESRTSGWTGTPVVSELIAEGRWTGWGMTARGWGWGTTTFRGHLLSYNSRNFFLTGLFPSLFNIWRARPISSCFLPDFDRPAKPSNDWSSETRKLNNMCCVERNMTHSQNCALSFREHTPKKQISMVFSYPKIRQFVHVAFSEIVKLDPAPLVFSVITENN